MPRQNTGATRERPADQRTSDDVRVLYEQGLGKEKELKETRPSTDARLKNIFLWGLCFPDRQFPAATAERDSKAEDLAIEGQKYLALLDLLAQAPNRTTRWYWIAQWLNDEGVATPDQLLPKDIFSELTKKGKERLKGFSWTALQHADLVRYWLPYGESLLFAAIGVRQRRKLDFVKELTELGYRDLPVNFPWSKLWHSPVAFTCEWLEMRGGVPMVKARKETEPGRTLQNAYSKIYKKCCYVCGRRAQGRFNRDGIVLLRCNEHSVDILSRSRSE